MTDARSQAEALQATRRRWRQAALSTTPVDMARAVAAMDALYEATIGRPPRHILLFASPLQCEQAGAFLNVSMRARPPDWIDRRSPDILLEIRRRMGPGGGTPLRPVSDFYRTRLDEPVRRQLGQLHWDRPSVRGLEEAREALLQQFRPEDPNAVRSKAGKDWLRGNDLAVDRAANLGHWMGWVAEREYTAMAFPTAALEGSGRLAAALRAVCEECGWCWLYPDFAVVSDRPQYIRLDGNDRVHAENGPAIGYRDGFAVYAIGGLRVPERIVMHPGGISFRDIQTEPNVEVRRIMLERMGHARYLQKSGAELVSHDETGALWQSMFTSYGRLHQLRFVEVVNGTREADGSYKHYFLRVPPNVTTARQAVAWTYGLTAEEYEPLIRT
jgi:hypothetical protein